MIKLQQETLSVFYHQGKIPYAVFPSALEAIKTLAPYYDAIFFDMDRMIIPFNSEVVYPEFKEIMKVIWDVKKAVITNKGGAAWGEYKKDPKYPTYEEDKAKMSRVLIDQLGFKPAEIFACWGFQKGAEWLLPKALKYGDPGTDPYDRKPQPGMLLKAMILHGVDLHRTLFVGDSRSDVAAAAAAKVDALLVKMEMY